MFIVDAFFQIFDFFRALLLANQVPQDNAEATVFNFISFLINLFSFLPQ